MLVDEEAKKQASGDALRDDIEMDDKMLDLKKPSQR